MEKLKALFLHPYNVSHDQLPEEIDEAKKFLKEIISTDDLSINFHTTSFKCFKSFTKIDKFDKLEILGLFNYMSSMDLSMSVYCVGYYIEISKFLEKYDVVFIYTSENSKNKACDSEEDTICKIIKFVQNKLGGNRDICFLKYDSNKSAIRPNDVKYLDRAKILPVKQAVYDYIYPIAKVALVTYEDIKDDYLQYLLDNIFGKYLKDNYDIYKYRDYFNLSSFTIDEVYSHDSLTVNKTQEMMNEYDYIFVLFDRNNDRSIPNETLRMNKFFRDLVLFKQVYTAFNFRAIPFSITYISMNNDDNLVVPVISRYDDYDLDKLYDHIIDMEKEFGSLREEKDDEMKNENDEKSTHENVQEAVDTINNKVNEFVERHKDDVKEEDEEFTPSLSPNTCSECPVSYDSVRLQSRVFDWLCSKARTTASQLNEMFNTIDAFMAKISVGSEVYYYNKTYIVTDIIDREKGIIKLGLDTTGCGYVVNSIIVELTENNAWKQYSTEFKSNDEPIL